MRLKRPLPTRHGSCTAAMSFIVLPLLLIYFRPSVFSINIATAAAASEVVVSPKSGRTQGQVISGHVSSYVMKALDDAAGITGFDEDWPAAAGYGIRSRLLRRSANRPFDVDLSSQEFHRLRNNRGGRRRAEDLSLPGDASSLDPALSSLGARTVSSTAGAAASSQPATSKVVGTAAVPPGTDQPPPGSTNDDNKRMPGTPAGWWEKLYVEGRHPSGRRSASAAVYRVMKAGDTDDEESTKADIDDRRLEEEKDAALDRKGNGDDAPLSPPTSPTPGDPVPIPSRISPGPPSSSSVVKPHWKPPDYDRIAKEYMVISGGFNDDDWSGFPVWAFDMTGDISQPAESEGVYKWYDLAAGGGGAEAVGPDGRVGHMSAVHDGYLYVFGGLLYRRKMFYLEDGVNMWRAKIDSLLPHSSTTSTNPSNSGDDKGDSDGDSSRKNGIVWEKLSPQIIDPSGEDVGAKPALAVDEDGRFEPLSSMPTDDDETGPDGVRHRNQAGVSTSMPTKSPYHLPRGEIQGGHWYPSNADEDELFPKSAYVFFGGLHVTHKPNPHPYSSNFPTIQVDEALGDVWMYDFDKNEFHRMAPYPPESWQVDPQTGNYPIARTAHGSAIVNDELIVYGGMARSHVDAHVRYDGTTKWDALTDVWAFDLKERVWRERSIEPQLARSYHTLVGWGDGSIAAFGGFRTAETLAGDPIAFVFSDAIVSHPDENTWLKAQWPQIYSARTITNRLEHVSVLDKEGSMYVWGGRFKTVSQVYPAIWKLNIFNEDSNVIFSLAPPDGLDAYEAELEALHLLMAVMMFMSLIFTALYSSLRRQQIEMTAAGGNVGPGILARASRRTGLAQEAIDAFPVKTYGRSHPSEDEEAENSDNFVIDSDDDEGGSDVTGRRNPSRNQGLDNPEETCPICLVEYTDGDEVRTLFCNHDFHRECVDGWLESHASCPSCRYAFSNDVQGDGSTGETEGTNDANQEHFDPTWDNLRRSVWGEAPAITLAGLLASHNTLFAEHPGEADATEGSPEPSTRTRRQFIESPDSGQDEDDFTNDEHRSSMSVDVQRRIPRRIRIGRARGYRNIGQPTQTQAHGGETEMVELGEGTSNVV